MLPFPHFSLFVHSRVPQLIPQDGESLLFIPGLATRGERSEHQAAGSEISGIAGLRGRDGSWRQPWELSPEDARATPRELAESSAVAVASFDGKHSPALCAVTLCGWPFLPSQMSRAWLVARRSMASSREGETGIAVCVDALTLDIECYDLATGCPLPFDPGHDSDAELGT